MPSDAYFQALIDWEQSPDPDPVARPTIWGHLRVELPDFSAFYTGLMAYQRPRLMTEYGSFSGGLESALVRQQLGDSVVWVDLYGKGFVELTLEFVKRDDLQREDPQAFLDVQFLDTRANARERFEVTSFADWGRGILVARHKAGGGQVTLAMSPGISDR